MKIYAPAVLAALSVAPLLTQAQFAQQRRQPPTQRVSTKTGAPTQDGAPAKRNLSSRDYFNLGVKYFLEGKAEQSVEAFSKAVEANSGNADAYFNLGNSLLLLNRRNDAAKAYKRAVSLNPKDGEAYNSLGKIYYDAGSYKLAAENFAHAISIFPGWADPYYHLGETYQRLGDAGAAARFYEKAARLKPAGAAPMEPAVASPSVVRAAPVNAARAPKPEVNNAPGGTRDRQSAAKSFYRLGVKHGRAKQFDEAIKAFQQAINYNPDYGNAYYGLAQAYADSGRWGEAVEAYQQVLRLNPKDDEAIYRLGEAYVKLREQSQSHPPAAVTAPAVERVSTDGKRAGSVPRDSPHGVPAPGRALSEVGASVAHPDPKVVAETAPASTSPAPAALTQIYCVGPGDVLDVRLLNASRTPPTLTLYTVTAGGLLDYPLIGDPLDVAGATVEEIGQRIAARLKRLGFSKELGVAVSVREYASHHVVVSGLVREPGAKVIRREAVPLYVLLADAQLSPEAEQVQVTTPAGAKTTINLSDTAALDMPITPGDVVTVRKRPEQFFYIGGKVSAPGQKTFRPGITLTQAVLAAGGKLSRGGTVKLLRQSREGYLSTSVFKLQELAAGKAPDISLQPDDRVEVIQ